MYITRKGQYALFFMINLAIHTGETVPVKQAAKEYDLSEKYLEQVASKLRHAGLVKVIRGNRGGYYLAKPVAQYTAAEIIDVIEGQQNAVDIDIYKISENNKTMNSIVHDLGQSVDKAIDGVLDHITLADMVKRYREESSFAYTI